MHPTCHYMEQDAPKLADQFLAMDSDRLSLFYLWGHSYELDGNDNWELMEEFCRKFGTAKDVWRASNMEIYLYMEALDRLVVSCDQKILFNPSAQDLWVTAVRQTGKNRRRKDSPPVKSSQVCAVNAQTWLNCNEL